MKKLLFLVVFIFIGISSYAQETIQIKNKHCYAARVSLIATNCDGETIRHRITVNRGMHTEVAPEGYIFNTAYININTPDPRCGIDLVGVSAPPASCIPCNGDLPSSTSGSSCVCGTFYVDWIVECDSNPQGKILIN